MRKIIAASCLAVSLSAYALASPPQQVLSRERAVKQADRRTVLEHMRVAAADRLIENDDEIAAYLAAQFNTLVLYDTEDSGNGGGAGILKTEQRIAFEIAFARTHGLYVVLGKATESLTDQVSAAGQTDHTSLTAQRLMHSLAPAASAQVSDDELRERLRLWDKYGHDIILGVFFLNDDAFLIRASVERQRHLYAVAHEAVADWPVFGMIGESGFDASAGDVEKYFDPNAFDHLIVLMYPLNLCDLTGEHLDVVSSVDPDNDMRHYVQRYLTHMGEKFVSQLKPGQLVILVVQAFAYDGEPAGHIPRPSDIHIEATVGKEVIQGWTGQERNTAIAYFLWDGSRAGLSGLWQRRDWMAAAEDNNRVDQRN